MGRLSRNWRQTVLAKAENLAVSLGGNRKGVALDTIARKQCINEIVFRPLLIAGGLALRDDGFVAYIKSDKRSADNYHRDFVMNGGLGLPPRLRFTIAHEIVHTFLYDLEARPPIAQLKAHDQGTFRALEGVCNAGAGRVILPSNRMKELLSSVSFFEPEFFLEFVRERGASVATAVVRCSTEHWGTQQGGIATITLRNGRPEVEVSARSVLAKGFLTYLDSGSEVLPHLAAEMQKYRCGVFREEFHVKGRVAHFSAPITARWLRTSSDPVRWLLSVELDEYPRSSGNQTVD